jgi:hypothetical protein
LVGLGLVFNQESAHDVVRYGCAGQGWVRCGRVWSLIGDGVIGNTLRFDRGILSSNLSSRAFMRF